VGFIFQFYNLIPILTACENVALITEISRDPMEPRMRGAGWTRDRHDHFPSQMSGGRSSAWRSRAPSPNGRGAGSATNPRAALDVKTGITVLEAIEK